MQDEDSSSHGDRFQGIGFQCVYKRERSWISYSTNVLLLTCRCYCHGFVFHYSNDTGRQWRSLKDEQAGYDDTLSFLVSSLIDWPGSQGPVGLRHEERDGGDTIASCC